MVNLFNTPMILGERVKERENIYNVLTPPPLASKDGD